MKKRYKILIAIVLIVAIAFVYLFSVTKMHEPEHPEISGSELTVNVVNDSLITCSDSWLKQNRFGIWELYIQGDSYSMGLKNGILTKDLLQYQEKVFVEQINELVPSKFTCSFLRVFLGWFNRKMLDYVPEEYQLEIAGVSKSASSQFNFIAPPFQRIMSYHGAHDMGHALQSLTLVGCTSFGVWNGFSADSSLLIGRNFDFYAGDRFSENKIIAFVKPENGYPFMSVTWGGMIGVVSGMNTEGLTITLNAEPSGIPFISKTPVSILARKILQYASTIDEAFEIAKEYEIFVSESFLIGSGKENKVALIEKTNKQTTLFKPTIDRITVTNHFINSSLIQTDKEKTDFNDASHYRMELVNSLIDSIGVFSVEEVAGILRDRKGKNGENIGFGNEKSINQLIAHHGIIFKPQEKKVWVSAAPFQLGTFVAYDLDEIFAGPDSFATKTTYLSDENIAPDEFLEGDEYSQFLQYKNALSTIQHKIKKQINNY
ncbi:MAG: hypothetical protein IPF54_02185 [Draconibacterium sp.]|nr:hypothetical protein [Draconibacterium sp.]